MNIAKHRLWKKANMLTGYAETAELWTQCVAGVKKYSSDVLGVDLGSFWWSAINWWNTGSPFAWKPFSRIENNPTFVPRVWDICFFQIGTYWHVAIIDEMSTTRVAFVIEQNWWNGDGKGKDDYYQVKAYDYITPKILWVYRKY